MVAVTTIGPIGDRSEAVIAPRAIPLALEAQRELGVDVRHEWLPSRRRHRLAIDTVSGADQTPT